ncbi:hypothetical protein BGZ76_004482 [Entomortierella beljakovae]|nr:hypothetical protein BGZ76_004482 [Entomortierella beljakovae]
MTSSVTLESDECANYNNKKNASLVSSDTPLYNANSNVVNKIECNTSGESSLSSTTTTTSNSANASSSTNEDSIALEKTNDSTSLTPEKDSSSITPQTKNDSNTDHDNHNDVKEKTAIERLTAWAIREEKRNPIAVRGFGGFITAFYLLAVPESTRLHRAHTIANFGKHSDQYLEIIDRVPSWSETSEKSTDGVKGVNLPETKEEKHERVCISSDIDPVVEEMITFTLRDFVNVPVGLISEGQHNIPLRASLVTMAMNVYSRLSNMRLPETALLGVFGMQNSFIVHLRAYRELRGSKLPIEKYVSTYANADSVLGRCYRKEERLKQFRSTAKAICQALLTKNDQQSIALFAIMQEIMATHVLESTLDHICDPDYVNLTIIDYFSTPDQNEKAGVESADVDIRPGASASKPNSTETTPNDAPISTLADSILMNAADLMDKSTFNNQDNEKMMSRSTEQISNQQSLSPNDTVSTSLKSTANKNGYDASPDHSNSPRPLASTPEPKVLGNQPLSQPSIPPLPPRAKARWINVTDMTNQRPKTLMTNSDLSYMVEVQIDEDQGWVVTRTFQQLEQLHAALILQFPIVQRATFPWWRLQPSDKVCNGLQNFLRSMLTTPEVGDSALLSWFLSKELDQNPELAQHGFGSPPPSSTSSILPFPPLSDSVIGVAAAQGAKTALRQASEASLSAGRFFKSLGSAVNPGSSPQLLADDRSVRGSFESERSIRSVSSTLTLTDQRSINGMPLPSFTDTDSQPISNIGDGTRFSQRMSFTSGGHKSIDEINSPTPISPPQTHSITSSSTSQQYTSGNRQSIISPHNEANISRTEISSTPVIHSTKQTTTIQGMSNIPPVSTSSTPLAQSSPASVPTGPKKPTIPLLSADELDLLIETTFTVLEDMMDFSKGQSIRRMTFGMLRELVRKSYRVAINESFSAWVEQSTSHEKAVETVNWMKDDFFWPNGEWPLVPAETSGRSLKEREETREKARELFKMMLPGSLSTVLGKETVSRGLMDVFEMFQVKELNMGLALSVLEMTVRLVFTR